MKASVAIRIFCATTAFALLVAGSVPVWRGYVQTHDEQKGVPFRRKFVSAYGLCCRMVGLRCCNGCVKLLKSNQLMLPTRERRCMAPEAAKVAAFSEFCRTNGVLYLYVQLPKKLDVGRKMLPPGVKDVAYENADELLRGLASAGVAAEDWRTNFADSAKQVAANFYTSDTHWNNPASLRAARELVRSFVRHGGADGAAAKRAESLLRPKRWRREKAARYFFGALAKRTGRYYTVANDVTFLLPEFETELTFGLPEQKREEKGSFGEVAIPAYVRLKAGKKDLPFSAQYAGGDERFIRLTNARAPLEKKILLLGDSFSRSVRTYLWTAVREIVAIDLRQYDTPLNVARLVLEERPDIVVQMPTAAALTADARAGEKRGHPAAFDYGL